MQVEASRGPIEELDVQALAVAVFKSEKADDGFLKKLDELSGGLVRSVLDADEFTGKEGEDDCCSAEGCRRCVRNNGDGCPGRLHFPLRSG